MGQTEDCGAGRIKGWNTNVELGAPVKSPEDHLHQNRGDTSNLVSRGHLILTEAQQDRPLAWNLHVQCALITQKYKGELGTGGGVPRWRGAQVEGYPGGGVPSL